MRRNNANHQSLMGNHGLRTAMRTMGPLLIVIAALSACSSGGDAMFRTAEYAVRGGARTDSSQLNPKFQYLRVTTQGRSAFLALGSVDKDSQGPIEVWYSAQREVLRLQNGRLVGASGMTTEWRNVSVPKLPSWSQVASAVHWTRFRDVMPGYRYGVQDKLVLEKIAVPSKSALQQVNPKTLTWFEERKENDRGGFRLAKWFGGANEDALPPARYAVDLSGGREVVVYGEQCLSAQLCLTWQRWNAKPAADVRK